MFTVTDVDSGLVFETDADLLEDACMEATREFATLAPQACNFFLEVTSDTLDAPVRVEARVELRRVITFIPQDD